MEFRLRKIVFFIPIFPILYKSKFQLHLKLEFTLKIYDQIQALNEEGYSQTAIAKRLGINQSTVSRELKKGNSHTNASYQ
jgi:IS30 family transposase